MNPLTTLIQQEISQSGPISFARFMALALYAPGLGYYERQPEIGRGGDFYTSVSVGDLFGRMLAFDFAHRLETVQARHASGPLQIVETGAHRGQLAGDILRWMRERSPELFARVDYWLVEPSPSHRQWQQAALGEFGPKLKWAADLSEVSKTCGGVRGIILSNELLDAMPVYRLRWDAAGNCWGEWRVGWDGAQFCWLATPLSDEPAGYAPVIPIELANVLPDGFAMEVSPWAINWWKTAASALEAGALITFDYGLSEQEFLVPERAKGTLRAYANHRISDDVLANAGEQDLTAHINFTAIQTAGEQSGLTTERHESQGKFLTQVFERAWKKWPDDWTPSRIRQFQTLIHPNHLGRAFRVLAQVR